MTLVKINSCKGFIVSLILLIASVTGLLFCTIHIDLTIEKDLKLSLYFWICLKKRKIGVKVLIEGFR